MRRRMIAVLSALTVVMAAVFPLAPTLASPAAAASVSATPSSNPTPVYRFYKTDGSHFFTNNESEKNQVIASAPAYHYEGIAFYSQPTQVSGTQPVYRFYNFLQGVHFYTINFNEYQNVLNTAAWTFRYEGIAYYANPSQVAATTPVYRFYKFTQGVHFYTSNKGESDNLQATATSEYRYEGIAYYLPTQLTFSGTGNGVTDTFVLPSTLSVFTSSYTGASNFIVQLKDATTGEVWDTTVNTIGNYAGSTAEGTDESSYVLQVQSSGTWSIAITQPKDSVGLQATFSGTGDQATPLFTTLAGAKTITYSYTGTSNFIVWLYDANGYIVDLIANEIGSTSGQVFEVTDTANYMMSVQSSGSWTISIG